MNFGVVRSLIPYASFGYVDRRSLLQKSPHLLKLAATGACIIQQITELARVGFDVGDILLKPRIAFQDQHLVFWPT